MRRTTTSHRGFLLGVTILVTLSVSTAGASAPKSEVRPRAAKPGSATAAERAATVLRGVFSANAVGIFGGVTIEGDGVTVLVTDPPRATRTLTSARSALSSEGNRTTVALRQVPHSEVDLLALQERVVGEQQQLAAIGIEVTRVGPSAGLDALDVAVKAASPQTAALLQARYGGAIRLLEEDAWTTTSRRVDSQPWWGGIFFDGPNLCTSGFNWLIGTSSVHATTAGHCGSGTWRNNGAVVGSTSALRRDVQTDAQILPANAQGFIYNGGLDDFNNVRVGWYYTSQAAGSSYNVCAGGRNFGQRCGSRVYLTNQCISYAQGYTTCGQIVAQQSGGNFPGTFGDSGGPVYTYHADGSVLARGLITGGYAPNLTLWSYSPVHRIQGAFGGAPLGF